MKVEILQNALLEHSAILFKWPLKTGFTVLVIDFIIKSHVLYFNKQFM